MDLNEITKACGLVCLVVFIKHFKFAEYLQCIDYILGQESSTKGILKLESCAFLNGRIFIFIHKALIFYEAKQLSKNIQNH